MNRDNLFNELYDTLNGISEIPAGEYENFKNEFHMVEFKKGEYWIHSGEKESRVGIIVSGLIRMYYIGNNDEEYTKDFCKSKEFLSAYSSLLQDQPTELNIQMMTDSKVLVASHKQYKKLSETHPCWNNLNRKIAEMLFIKKETREKELLLLSAKERYLKFIDNYSDIYLQIPQYHIASFLGISPVSLSRLKK